MIEPRKDTASGSDNDARNAEAHKIIFEMGLKDASFEQEREEDFVSGLIDKLDQYKGNAFISSRQLFWLRDLKEKYL